MIPLLESSALIDGGDDVDDSPSDPCEENAETSGSPVGSSPFDFPGMKRPLNEFTTMDVMRRNKMPPGNDSRRWRHSSSFVSQYLLVILYSILGNVMNNAERRRNVWKRVCFGLTVVVAVVVDVDFDNAVGGGRRAIVPASPFLDAEGGLFSAES